MTEPGLPIEQMIKQVRVAVLEATDGAQTPWDEVRTLHDPQQLVLFLRSYPSSRFAPEARVLLNEALAEPTPAPEIAAPPPAPAVASTAEAALFEQARTTNTVEGYRAYLDAFPNGLHADLARAEAVNLAAPAIESAGLTSSDGAAAESVAGQIGSTVPLAIDEPTVAGRSIEQASQMSPCFSPVEGVDAAAWQDQTCSTCHAWTPDALCEQGQFHVR